VLPERLSVTGPSSSWKTSCSICFRILVYEDASTEALNYLNHGVFIIWNTTAPGALVTGSFDRVYSLSDLTRLLAGKSRTVKPHSSARWPKTVKMIAEYLEHALQFERMAADEKNPELKAQLERQAAAYRKLAAKRAKKLGLQPPPSRGNWRPHPASTNGCRRRGCRHRSESSLLVRQRNHHWSTLTKDLD